MATTDELLAANERYAARFDKGHLPLPPARRVAIVTCMDARIDPAKALGLSEGDAHVIRNAGGRAHEALRSLVISQRLLGTREVVVIHHTDCGMLTFTDDELRGKVREELGADASHIAFLPFKDLGASVRQDVAYLRASPLIPEDVPIRGFVYDVRTGTVSEVTVEEQAAA
jgi:carbonic anhydrase